MALSRPLFVGFSSASKAAREGGDLEVTVQTARGPRVFTLPWFIVRDADALLERWRREEHEAVLLTMNDGVLGETLYEAAGAGGLRDTTFLLASGVDVNYSHGIWTALKKSAFCGHIAVVTVLLDAGAERRDEALCNAAAGGRTNVVEFLLGRGADVHWNFDCPVYVAARNGHLATVRLLLDRGADADVTDVDGVTALQWARHNGHVAVAALLLEHGAINAPVDDDVMFLDPEDWEEDDN